MKHLKLSFISILCLVLFKLNAQVDYEGNQFYIDFKPDFPIPTSEIVGNNVVLSTSDPQLQTIFNSVNFTEFIQMLPCSLDVSLSRIYRISCETNINTIYNQISSLGFVHNRIEKIPVFSSASNCNIFSFLFFMSCLSSVVLPTCLAPIIIAAIPSKNLP